MYEIVGASSRSPTVFVTAGSSAAGASAGFAAAASGAAVVLVAADDGALGADAGAVDGAGAGADVGSAAGGGLPHAETMQMRANEARDVRDFMDPAT
jgi:hypothetical protein